MKTPKKISSKKDTSASEKKSHSKDNVENDVPAFLPVDEDDDFDLPMDDLDELDALDDDDDDF